MNQTTHPPCSCKTSDAPLESVPRAAFDIMRQRVNELAAVVHQLAKNQPGADSPLPAGLFGSRSLAGHSEPTALVARVARIVGGEEVSPGEFPHCALLGRRTGTGARWFCSGVLIHPRVVLTAAHCMPAAPNLVALGAENFMDLQGKEIISIVKSFVHPRYNPQALVANHDIAVLILERPATTPPVDAAGTPELAAATRVTLAGFGNNDIYSSTGFGIKRKVTVDIKALRRSAQQNLDAEEAQYGFESDDEFVAGNPVMDSCNGDSGGPAYIHSGGRFLVAGLTSRGIREDPADITPCGDGGIYTRVDMHWDWIRDLAARYLS